MYLAWKHGEDPYRLFHRLTPDYRPIRDPSLPPKPPRWPGRLKRLIYGFAQAAEIERVQELRAMIGKGM